MKKFKVRNFLVSVAIGLIIPFSSFSQLPGRSPSPNPQPPANVDQDSTALYAEIVRLQEILAQLIAELARREALQPSASCHDFLLNFGIGSVGADVLPLQNILGQREGLTVNTDGVFDERTAAAVTAFQERYRSEILAPLGLQSGTGYVGARTRSKLNALYGCGGALPPRISSFVGPTTLAVGQLGSWRVTAQDPEGGTLTYAITWGDTPSPNPGSLSFGTSANFTHTYQVAGSYQVTVYVRDVSGRETSQGKAVAVQTGQAATPLLTVTSPNGGEAWRIGTNETIRWSVAQAEMNRERYRYASARNLLAQLPREVSPIGPPAQSEFSIELLSYTNSNVYTIRSGGVAEASFTWEVGRYGESAAQTFVPDGRYTIRVCDVRSGYCDTSNAPFDILPRSQTASPLPTVTLSASPSSISTGGQVTITWTSQNAVRCIKSSGWSGTTGTSGSETVTSNSTQTFSIRCENSSGVSSPLASATVSVTQVISQNLPTAPRNLTATGRADHATLVWRVPSGAAPITGYKVTRDGIELAQLGNVISYTDTGLSPDRGYSYAVSARDASGNFSPASSVAVQTSARLTGGLSPSYYMLLWSTVSEIPLRITINWPQQLGQTNLYTVYRKESAAASWGSPVATLSGGATSYEDRSVSLGRVYWYKIEGNTDLGEIMVAVRRPLVDRRGIVLLVVENSLLSSANAEISLLIHDLVGDGWKVTTIPVSRNDSPVSVKDRIRQEYIRNPGETKAAYLLGHVPVPYSGFIAPDGHGDHYGAWSTDTYYADVDGAWTDTATRLLDPSWPTNFHAGEGALRPENRNFPGDGKFDQNIAPSVLELEVGRVDFSNMPQFLPRSEDHLIKQYIRKSHEFRQGRKPLPENGLIHASLGANSGNGFNAQKSFSAAVSPFSVTTLSFPGGLGQGALMTFLDSTAHFEALYNVPASTEIFSRTDPPTYFYEMFGSYFGDFDSSNNLLRAPLAGKDFGLTNAWGGTQRLGFALGETIGTAYLGYQNKISKSVIKNLIGDPTLRLHTFRAPENLRFSLINGQLELAWDPVDDSVLGYHVYRSLQSTGPYERLTTETIPNTSFRDEGIGVSPGAYHYMVRAVKLQMSGEGSYVNLSQGVIRTAQISSLSSGGMVVNSINPSPELPMLQNPTWNVPTPRTPTIFPVTVEPSVVKPGEKVKLTYHFSPGPVDYPYRVYTDFWVNGVNSFRDEHSLPISPTNWYEDVTYSVQFRIPANAPSGEYKMNAGMYSGSRQPEFIPAPGVIVESDKYYRVGNFTVLPTQTTISNVRVTPSAPEEGQNLEVRWDSAGVDRVTITLGTTVQDYLAIADNIANTGSYTWRIISGVAGADVIVKVKKADNSLVVAQSPVFQIADHVPPGPPIGVSAVLKTTQSGQKYIETRWATPVDEDLFYYKLYISAESGVYASVSEEVYTSPHNILNPITGRNYIVFTSVDLNNNESVRSEEVFVDVPAP